MKNNQIIIIILIAIIVGSAGFFGGMQYQKNQVSVSSQSGRANAQGNFRGRNGANGMRPVAGEIITSDAKSITVKMQDGSSKIVLMSGSTQINKTQSGVIADLKTGQQVAVFGTTNSDGSISAQSIQLNPMFSRGQGNTSSQSGTAQ